MRKNKRNNFIKKNNGITLIALIITIIVILTLAIITINAMKGDSIINYAYKAKEETQEASDIEGIKEAFLLAKGFKQNGKIMVEDFQKCLDMAFDENYAEALEVVEKFIVKIGDKYYEVDDRGNAGSAKKLSPIEQAGQIKKKGSGTISDPYRIECIEDLVNFSQILQKTSSAAERLSGKYIVLTQNLDFTSIFSYSDYKTTYRFDNTKNAYIKDETSETTLIELLNNKEGQGFIPIGSYSTTGGVCSGYSGTFDGNGYEIANVYINTSSAGLFRGGKDATIKNLTVSGYIKGSSAAGGIMASSAATKFYNCTNKATVVGSSYNGGIVGRDITSGVLIEDCHNEGYATNGICGEISGTVNRCYNTAKETRSKRYWFCF